MPTTWQPLSDTMAGKLTLWQPLAGFVSVFGFGTDVGIYGANANTDNDENDNDTGTNSPIG